MHACFVASGAYLVSYLLGLVAGHLAYLIGVEAITAVQRQAKQTKFQIWL